MMSPLCRRAVELGAVSGVFTPEEMGKALGLDGASPAYRAVLWRDLSAYVAEVLTPAFGWYLKPDARLSILKQLVSREQVRGLIEDAPSVCADDSFAGLLRDLLSSQAVAVETKAYGRNQEKGVLSEMRRAGQLLDAVQFAQHSPATDIDTLKRAAGEVKRHIVELRQRRDMLIVLPRRHFGYETERRKLSRFLRSAEDTADDRPVFLSGIGGVGKSALHARLFRHWQQRNDGPLTVILDFDRRQLNAGSPLELLKEFLRQCSVGVFEKGFPVRIAKEVGEGLTALRHGLADVSVDGTFDLQMSEIASTHLSALQQNWAAPLGYQPIAVAFDSFEALDRRGGSNVEMVLRLEELLRRFLPRMRSIFAGREEPLSDEHMDRRFGPAARRIRLIGIPPAAGAQLIKEEDQRLEGPEKARLKNEDEHLRIAEILKGHPLAMLMLVKFAHARPNEIDRLLGELGQENGQFEAEFAQVFLYERILERISDPEVRALAHPGLVLRQLNTDLIREVLSVPGMGHKPDMPVTEAEAERLKEALEREYWLVEPDDQGFDLRHRPDLRRMMLPGLFAPPREGDSAAEREKKETLTARVIDVCAYAAHYFRHGPPEDETNARARWHALPEQLRQAHGFYYTSFESPNSPEDMTVEQARIMDHELGEDIETMPLAWRALIKAQLDYVVTDDEQETLKDELFEQVESSVFKMESKVGRSGVEDSHFFNTPPLNAPPDPKARASAARLERQIADAFARVEFGRVADLASRYLHVLATDDGTAARRFDKLAKQDVTQTPLWKVLLVAGVQASGLTDINLDFFEIQDAPYLPLCDAIGMAARRDVAVPRRLRPYGEGEMSLHTYRQNVFDAFDLGEPSSGAERQGNFGFLALAPSRLGDVFFARADQDSKFLEVAQAVFDSKELKAYDLQALYGEAQSTIFSISFVANVFADSKYAERWKMLRGLTPELYDPIITTLRRADAETIKALNALLLEEAPRWPVDLRLAHDFIDETAPLIVETADRYGLLRRFAQVLALPHPQLQSVVDMHDALTRWFFPPMLDQESISPLSSS